MYQLPQSTGQVSIVGHDFRVARTHTVRGQMAWGGRTQQPGYAPQKEGHEGVEGVREEAGHLVRNTELHPNCSAGLGGTGVVTGLTAEGLCLRKEFYAFVVLFLKHILIDLFFF